MQRHGSLDKKTGHALEKIPHVLDDMIRENAHLPDTQILDTLHSIGFDHVTIFNLRYRRKRLGIKKYLGKHCKALITKMAIETYGDACEICHYPLIVEVHHIVAKRHNGTNDITNLTVLCPSCHGMITRKILTLKSRNDIPAVRATLKNMLHGWSIS